MFRDIIILKYDIDELRRNHPIIGYVYHIIFRHKVMNVMSSLFNRHVDRELLRGYYDFLNLTRINKKENFEERTGYKVDLYSDKNTIYFAFNGDQKIVIYICKDSLDINFLSPEKNYMFSVRDNLLDFDKADKTKYEFVKEIDEIILEVMSASVLLFFNKKPERMIGK